MGANPASGVNYSFGRWKSSAVAAIPGRGGRGIGLNPEDFAMRRGLSGPLPGRPPTRVRGLSAEDHFRGGRVEAVSEVV